MAGERKPWYDSKAMKHISAFSDLWGAIGAVVAIGGLAIGGYAVFHKEVDDYVNNHTLDAYRIALGAFAIAALGFIVALVKMRIYRTRALHAESKVAAKVEIKMPKARIKASSAVGHFLRPTQEDLMLWRWYLVTLTPEHKPVRTLELGTLQEWRWDWFKSLENLLEFSQPKWIFRENRLEGHRQAMLGPCAEVLEVLHDYGQPKALGMTGFPVPQDFATDAEYLSMKDRWDKARNAFVSANHALFLTARELGFQIG